MPIVACPCGKRLRANDALAGKRVKCPGCGRPLVIPQSTLLDEVLDEELDRAAPSPPTAAPLPRSRRQQRSTTAQGRLLVALLAVGGLVVLAVVIALVSTLFSTSGTDVSQHPAHEPAASSPAGEPVADSSGGRATAPADSAEESPPKVESRSPTAALASKPASVSRTTQPSAPRQRGAGVTTPERSRPSRNREPPAARSGDGANQSRQNTIRLSTGVALAQTLPTGTAMGFSVDYEFVGAPPSGQISLIWVLEAGNGQSVRQPVQMTEKGSLQGFVPQFRPEHAPFSTHIEDRSGNRLSESLPLR